MLLGLLLTLAASPQSTVSISSVTVDRSRLGPARDATPHARTLEESAGTGWEERPDLSFAPGALPRVSAGVQVRSLATIQTPTGQRIAGPAGVLGSVSPSPTVYEVTIQPGTGFNERFLVQQTGFSGPRPMLVVFHKFGVSHYDALFNTSYFEEARRRGWYCVAPLSGGQTHFSDERSHVHTEAVLEWMRASFQVDPTRVYGVGFSMGGGAAMNYAARHVDPDGVMFAAVFNQSGILSHEDTYPQSSLVVQQMYDDRYGNGLPGSATPYALQRGSVFSFDPLTLAVDMETDLGRNLLHLATHTTRATADVPYLMTQNDLFHAHQLARGANPARHVLSVVNYVGHSWDAVSEGAACNWLRNYQLVLPSSGDTLAHENDRFFHFTIEQDAPGSFTPFSWNVQATANSLSLSATANLMRILVHTGSAGLTTSAALTVSTATADGLADEVVLEGYSLVPGSVLRDGVPTLAWSYDAQVGRVTLLETDGAAPHVWVVFP